MTLNGQHLLGELKSYLSLIIRIPNNKITIIQKDPTIPIHGGVIGAIVAQIPVGLSFALEVSVSTVLGKPIQARALSLMMSQIPVGLPVALQLRASRVICTKVDATREWLRRVTRLVAPDCEFQFRFATFSFVRKADPAETIRFLTTWESLERISFRQRVLESEYRTSLFQSPCLKKISLQLDNLPERQIPDVINLLRRNYPTLHELKATVSLGVSLAPFAVA